MTRSLRFAIALAICLITLLGYSVDTNHVRVGDTFPARLLPLTIMGEGDLDFNEYVAAAPEGRGLAEFYMFNRVGDRVISYYSIVPGLINLPTHYAARLIGVDNFAEYQLLGRITATLCTAGSVFFMAWILLGLCRQTSTAIIFTLVYAFATSAWSVAATALWQHGPSLLFLCAAFAGLCSRHRLGALFAGLMLGMAVWNRLPNGGYALMTGLYLALYRPKDLLVFLAGASVPALGLFSYSHSHWGTVTALGEGHQVALMGGPLLKNLAGLLISPNRGLFVYSPVLLFSLPMLYRVLARPGRQPLLFAWSLGALAILFAHAYWTIWWGGHSFGYRLITETVPVFIILLALSYERWISKSRLALAGFAVLASASFYVHFLGAVHYPGNWNNSPRDIDDAPERAWDFRDTQIGRLGDKLFEATDEAGQPHPDTDPN
jgi:hypothetical protein